MPGGFNIAFPFGRSLNASGGIQLESDWTLTGGVSPTLYIPVNSTNAISYIQGKVSGQTDFELDYAQAVLESMINSR